MANPQSGMGLPVTLILITFTLTAAIWLVERTNQGLKHAHMFRKIKTSNALANNVVTDLMRQFSQTYQGDHYSAEALERNPTFYNNGYSVVTTSANSLQHSVAFEAQGSYGQDPDNPQNVKTLTGVIKFISALTTFGTMWRDAFTTSASNITYSGKLWANGGWTVTGANCRVEGGPVFVNGNIAATGAGTLVINGDLYRSGTRTGAITVTGNDYTYLPDLTWPTIDTTYFDTYSNVKVTANTNVRFNSNGTVRIGTITYTIPSTGFIIYGQNCVITASGTVRGHVTVASLRVSGATGGNITIDGNVTYATTGSTSLANASDSIAMISTHGQTWDLATVPANGFRFISGAYWINSGTTTGTEIITIGSGAANKGIKFFGTRNKALSGTTSSITYAFDTNLDTYPPPGLPERPYLVSWQLK